MKRITGNAIDARAEMCRIIGGMGIAGESWIQSGDICGSEYPKWNVSVEEQYM